MKALVVVSALSVMVTAAVAREGGSLDPAGTWLTEDGRAKIRVEKCGTDHAHLCGSVVWLDEPNDDKGHPKLDIKNPDPAKRNRPALGMPLFTDVAVDEDQTYSGKIYNADNGKTYDVTFKVDKPSELHVKGCMLSILCGSQNWTRVSDIAPAAVATTTPAKKPKPAAAPAE